MVRKFKGIVAFDASSFIPYKNISCQYYDALFISSHKLIGGIGGSGLLAIKKIFVETSLALQQVELWAMFLALHNATFVMKKL